MTSPSVGILSRPSHPKAKKIRQLSSLLDHRLAAYALVATAAASGVPAFAQAASDPIVFTPAIATGIGATDSAAPERNSIVYTPASINFFGDFNQHQVIDIDFTSENVANITINVSGHYSISFGGSSTFVRAGASWQGSVMPHVLAYGNHIGASAKFAGQGEVIYSVWSRAHDQHVCRGVFRKTQSGYLGVRFSISGETHYGWIALSANCGPGGKGGGTNVSGTITGYAYNKVPNEHIDAGQTSSESEEKREETKPSMPEPGTLAALSLGSVVRRP
jgi:hypothetical protein